ncbi:MAG: hypothetical protein ACRC5W_08130 [Cetobacterium sp.]|uniref:hypothetical protein n=1 Tax=Cetobacterium sp. TaxID=2071632 RepID=UPI003F375D18
MKKKLFLFLFLYSLLRADYLITNGEIALFYDVQNNILKNVRDKKIEKDILSNLQILLIKDYKVYRAKKYYAETKFLNGKNIFHIKYYIENEILEVYIVLSNEQKNSIYIYTNLNKLTWKAPYDLVYKFSVLNLEGNIQNKDGYYKYDNLNILKNDSSKLIVSTEQNFEDFKVKYLETSLKKELDERIYLVKNIKNKVDGDFLNIILEKESPRFMNLTFEEVLSKEIEFWDSFDKKYEFLRRNVVNQIKNFYLISTSNYAQNSLNMNMSRVNYIRQLKVLHLNAILNRTEKIPNFNFNKEDNIQNIYSYYYYFKILELKNKKISTELIAKNSKLITNDILEIYKSIINKEGEWLESSVIFYRFLLDVEKYNLIFLDFESLEKMKSEIQNVVKKEVINSSGNLKNNEYIKYLDVLSTAEQEKIIKNELKKINNNSFYLLESPTGVDITANLNLALLLYKNNFVVESDKIFYNIDYFVNLNDIYSKLDLEEIFSYLLNIHYRGLI